MTNVHWVQQQDSHGCLVACLAMVTGDSYAFVKQWFVERGQRFDGTGGLIDLYVEMYLGERGYAYRKHFRYLPGNTPRSVWPSLPFAPVHICGVNGAGDHGVVMQADGVVVDPIAEPRRTLADYSDVAYIIGIWNVKRAARANAKAELLIEPLRARARELGYAIGVHGSLARDIDLIAVPWTAAAASADELAAALLATAEAVNGCAFTINDSDARPNDYTRRNPEPKPHGRLAWSIHLGGGPFIDLSIMPRLVAGVTLT